MEERGIILTPYLDQEMVLNQKNILNYLKLLNFYF
jgi:hypothetical protein